LRTLAGKADPAARTRSNPVSGKWRGKNPPNKEKEGGKDATVLSARREKKERDQICDRMCSKGKERNVLCWRRVVEGFLRFSSSRGGFVFCSERGKKRGAVSWRRGRLWGKASSPRKLTQSDVSFEERPGQLPGGGGESLRKVWDTTLSRRGTGAGSEPKEKGKIPWGPLEEILREKDGRISEKGEGGSHLQDLGNLLVLQEGGGNSRLTSCGLLKRIAHIRRG